MRRQVIIIISILLLLNACSNSPGTIDNNNSQDSPKQSISKHIEKLTDPSLSGRKAGTRGDAKTALYLARYFQEAGLIPLGDGKTYFQSFPIDSYEAVMSGGRMTFRHALGAPKTSENILGLLQGKVQDIIVISAHFDHLGEIENDLFPGANDNASGVAAVLELINIMGEEKPKYSILFALWGAEEMGLLGSSYFCEKPPFPLENIKAVINLDSIGNVEEDWQLLCWSGMESKLSKEILLDLSHKGWQVNFENTEKHSSDHFSFNKKGIGGFTLLSPNWLHENHTPLDTSDKILLKPILKLINDLKSFLST